MFPPGKDGTMAKDPVYAEKLQIGYRWYDANKLKPMFEFGRLVVHISATRISVSNGRQHPRIIFTVKNEGSVAGAEVRRSISINDKDEPPLRLVGWSKISGTRRSETGRHHDTATNAKRGALTPTIGSSSPAAGYMWSRHATFDSAKIETVSVYASSNPY